MKGTNRTPSPGRYPAKPDADPRAIQEPIPGVPEVDQPPQQAKMVTPEIIPDIPDTPNDLNGDDQQGESTHLEFEINSFHLHVGLDIPPGAKVRINVTDTTDNKTQGFVVNGPAKPQPQNQSGGSDSQKAGSYSRLFNGERRKVRKSETGLDAVDLHTCSPKRKGAPHRF